MRLPIDPEAATQPRAPQTKRREQKFGFRVPRGNAPLPFRVLVSARWLGAALGAGLALLATLPRLSWRQRGALLGNVALLGMAAVARGVAQARQLELKRITLRVPTLPPALDGFKFVQLTDLHLGAAFTVENLRRALHWTEAQRPDLVVFTGDFISYKQHIPLLRAELREISAPHGVYAIFGNHDYWPDIQPIATVLHEKNVQILRNDQRRLDVNGTPLWLVGVDCIWENQHDLPRAFAPIPPNAPMIVLAHEPDIADEIAPYAPLIQLSGHTHAGHITAPGLGPLFLPRHGLRYYEGLQRVGGMWLYVSRGIGGYPLRFGCPPEVTEFTLRRS